MNEILTDNIVCARDRPKTGFVKISRLCLLRGGGGGGLKPFANRNTFMSLTFSNEIKNIITNFLPEFEFISIFTFYHRHSLGFPLH